MLWSFPFRKSHLSLVQNPRVHEFHSQTWSAPRKYETLPLATIRTLLVFTGTRSRAARLHFPTMQNSIQCTATEIPSVKVFFSHIGQANISPFFSLFLFSFFEETLDPWKDMICILTTPGLDLGSRSLLSKNTCGSSVLLSVWILPPPAEGVWHKRTVYLLLSGISFFFFFIPFLFLWVWTLMTHNCAKFLQFPPPCVQRCLPNLTIEINCS